MYLHTIDGQPAFYNGEQIVFAGHRLKIPNHLCDSLKSIRFQQGKSIAWRECQGWCDAMDYGYQRVKVEGTKR